MNLVTRCIWRLLFVAVAGQVGLSSVVAADANARAVENLAAFARLYGYVRFFHPSDEAAAIDWSKFAILGAATVRDAPDDATLRESLRGLFEPIALELKVLSASERAAAPAATTQPADGPHTFWQHFGVRLSDQSNIYQSRRVVAGKKVASETDKKRAPIFRPVAPPPFVLEKQLAPDIAIQLPLVLPLSPEGKAAVEKPPELAALHERRAAPDAKPAGWAVRVADVIIAWNVFQHFHPYIDSIGLNWEEVLRPTLRRALADRTRDEFRATLGEMVAQLQDGHAISFGDRIRDSLPIRVDVVEDQIVVTAAATGTSFKKGDILTRIDDVPALDFLRERERYISGSPQLRRFHALEKFGEGPDGSVARVDLLREGVSEHVEIKRSRQTIGFYTDPIVEFAFPPFAEVRPGIFYVNVPSISTSVLELRLPDLAAARGVIFDQRRDGRIGMNVAFPSLSIRPHEQIIPHLIDNTIHAPPMRIPRITQPDRVGWTWSESAWKVEPKAPRISGRVVFINDPLVGSYGETCMAMIAHYGLAKLVGGPTGGCDGNINPLTLPSGLRIIWTGMEMLKHDRSPIYITGFPPDYPVARTIDAVKEGHDEYLEKAIAVIEESAEPTKPSPNGK